MGRKRVWFRCHHCGHCCTDVVCLPTPWDVIQIVRATGLNPYDFLEFLPPGDIDQVPKSDPTWLRCNGQRYQMALRRDQNRCFFRDKKSGSCGAYEARPLVCRLFPFCVHETREGAFKSFTLHEKGRVECPRLRDGVVEVPPLYTLYCEDREHQEDYADLVAVFNRNASADKPPEDFIQLFIVGAKPRRKE
jgi:Fe-S-cluster containining protein